tara:strand:+ start:489 stop:1175 length:687 start_codon:yes stop_codon:yes gene_type:complete
MNDTIILITGQLNANFTDRLIESYKNVSNKLISTWKDTPSELIEKLKKDNFIILLNDEESLKNDQHKHNRQLLPIRNGILEAEKLGFKYVMRTRTDIFSNDFDKYLMKTRSMYQNKLTAIAGINNVKAGVYFLDIIICGEISKMLSMFVLKAPNNKKAYELYLIEMYTKKNKINAEELNQNFSFSLNTCLENEIEFIWVRDGKWKTPKRTIPDMKVIKEYCDDNFILR